jgi:type IV secretory pathway VirJ component
MITWLLTAALAAAPCDASMSWRRMGQITLCQPEAEPRAVVFLLSGDDGWTPMMQTLADEMTADGAVVVGIKTPVFLGHLNASKERCAYPAADFETLSQYLQKKLGLPQYHEPLLVGFSSGAALTYATAEQAPSHIFKGVIGLGFYAELNTGKPWCYEHGLLKRDRRAARSRLVPDTKGKFPWRVIQGETDKICAPTKAEAFVAKVPSGRYTTVPGAGHSLSPAFLPPVMAAVRELIGSAPSQPPPIDPDVGDLPIVEVPAAAGESSDVLVVLVSGDGGWASIDKELATLLATHGVATIGLDSLKYFWTPRTPKGTAMDVERILRHYQVEWRRPRLALIGYSFGADVLPFIVNELPDDLRARIALVTLLAPTDTAAFEFHLSDWLGGETESRLPTRPEIAKMSGVRLLCLQGGEDTAQTCSAVDKARGRSVTLPGGHHFDGDYAGLARLVLSELEEARQPATPRSP